MCFWFHFWYAQVSVYWIDSPGENNCQLDKYKEQLPKGTVERQKIR